MTEYTIGDAADFLGVTPKALRHWDSIGLLSPQWRTLGDYRLYTEEDLRVGAAIVLYRNMGFKLAEIPDLIEAPSDAALDRALRAHREALARKRDEVESQLRAVEDLITTTRLEGYTMEQMDKIKQYFGADLVAARDGGVAPDSEEAQELVERHRATINQWYEVTTSRQLILARMYVDDERFAEAYQGAQDYLLSLVEHRANQEGITNPSWDD